MNGKRCVVCRETPGDTTFNNLLTFPLGFVAAAVVQRHDGKGYKWHHGKLAINLSLHHSANRSCQPIRWQTKEIRDCRILFRWKIAVYLRLTMRRERDMAALNAHSPHSGRLHCWHFEVSSLRYQSSALFISDITRTTVTFHKIILPAGDSVNACWLLVENQTHTSFRLVRAFYVLFCHWYWYYRVVFALCQHSTVEKNRNYIEHRQWRRWMSNDIMSFCDLFCLTHRLLTQSRK